MSTATGSGLSALISPESNRRSNCGRSGYGAAWRGASTGRTPRVLAARRIARRGRRSVGIVERARRSVPCWPATRSCASSVRAVRRSSTLPVTSRSIVWLPSRCCGVTSTNQGVGAFPPGGAHGRPVVRALQRRHRLHRREVAGGSAVSGHRIPRPGVPWRRHRRRGTAACCRDGEGAENRETLPKAGQIARPAIATPPGRLQHNS